MKQFNNLQEKIDISIIIPVYNIENFLRQCIESVINQTLKTIEIILIDDGSTDNSGNICDEYAKSDNRIVVIHQKNKGASYARNVGLKIAKGEWVTFVDSDDWVENDLYEVAMKELNEKQADVFMFNYYNNYPKKQMKNNKAPQIDFIVENNEVRKLQLCILDTRAIKTLKVYGIYTQQDVEFQYRNQEWLGMSYLWNKIFRKSLIQSNNLKILLEDFKRVIYEDGIFCYQYFNKVKKVQYCSKCLYHHRRLENSIMKSFNPQIIQISNQILNEYFIEEKQKEKPKLQQVYVRAIRNFRDICFLYLFHKKNKESKREKIKELEKIVNHSIYQEAFKNIDEKILGKSFQYYFKYAKNGNYTLLRFFNKFEKLWQYIGMIKTKTKFYK